MQRLVWSSCVLAGAAVLMGRALSKDISPPRPPPPIAEKLEVAGWDVHLDLAALEDLPPSCFRSDALVVTVGGETPALTRWAWVSGAPEDLYVGKLRFSLGDAGELQLPPVLHGNKGVFHTTHFRTVLSGGTTLPGTERSEATLVMRTESDHLYGTLHLDVTSESLHCQVSVGLVGNRMGATLLARAD